ncbi:MAG: AMP-binding protein [Opitutaceae bacterium]|jgi:acyl-CoA synthetase (AMP-forming)/AMP-acid ligase II
MTIGDQLTEQARVRPEMVALIDDAAGRTLTFAQLDDEVAKAAAWWRARRLKRGQAVLVFVPMSAELYVALLAIFRIGSVALFLDPSAGKDHLERCCARWAPDALLAIPKAHLLRLRSRALRAIRLKVTTGGWLPATVRWLTGATVERVTTNDAQPQDAALVTFTSGSTGVPKGAVRTQGFLLAQYRALAPSIALEPGDVDLATLPVFTLANLAAGVTTVIPDVDLKKPCAVDAARVWAQIERRGVNRITASPAFFERLIEEGRARRATLTGLRKLYTGGAPVFPRLLEALRVLAPNAEVVAVYGSTEAEPIAHIGAHEIEADDLAAMRGGRGLLSGVPVDEVKLRVVRDRWGEARGELSATAFAAECLPSGEAGEIVVAGDHVLKGYLGGIGDEETKFRIEGEVWHRTGDAGLIDERGRVWLLGRCAARVDDSLGRLYPFGVECVAMTFAAVRRAAMVALDGRRVLVVEAERDERLADELSAAVAWAQVDDVRFMATLPVDRRHNAKIDYPELKRILGDLMG